MYCPGIVHTVIHNFFINLHNNRFWVKVITLNLSFVYSSKKQLKTI